ncbi:hypothetical protein O9K51_04969 [Purpureocillium lavendulum]|uniref:Uncharacterized protein n=1 Tax=Purpureocillium lavendulum TaxID=1247861 RepID=A0AB34FQM7_9HYPO|nr:hypothetical protein O9K51_04969 [Purpureocillium lavendulum]
MLHLAEIFGHRFQLFQLFTSLISRSRPLAPAPSQPNTSIIRLSLCIKPCIIIIISISIFIFFVIINNHHFAKMSTRPVSPDESRAVVLASAGSRAIRRATSTAHLLVEFEQWRRGEGDNEDDQASRLVKSMDDLPIKPMRELMKLLEKCIGELPSGDALQEFLGQIFDSGYTSNATNLLPPHPSIYPIIERTLVGTAQAYVGEVVDRHGRAHKVYPRAYLNETTKYLRIEFVAPNGVPLDPETASTMAWKDDGNVTGHLRQAIVDLYEQIDTIVIKHNRERAVRQARLYLKEYTEKGFRPLGDDEVVFANTKAMIWAQCPVLWLSMSAGDQVGPRATIIRQVNIKDEVE